MLPQSASKFGSMTLTRRLLPVYVLAAIFAFIIIDLSAHPFSPEPLVGSVIPSDGFQRYFSSADYSAPSEFTEEELADYRLLKQFKSRFAQTVPWNLSGWVGQDGNPDTPWLQRRRAGRETFDWPTTKRILVFGDSVSERTPEYGDWERRQQKALADGTREPWEEVPLGLKAEVKWADALYMIHSNTSELEYHNFASGGAVTDREVVPPLHETWQDLGSEIKNYEKQLQPVVDEQKGTRLPPGWTGRQELVVIMFGNNDEKQMARLNERDTDSATVHALVKSTIEHASKLYDDGFRNFLFMTAPPVDINPQTTLPNQGGYPDRLVTKAIHAEHTALLKAAVEVWDEKYATKGNGMLFDLDGFLRIVHQFPELFGITDLHRFTWTVDHVWRRPDFMGLMWNDSQGHPSGAVMKLIAAAIHGQLLRESRSMQFGTAQYHWFGSFGERPYPPAPEPPTQRVEQKLES